LSGFEEQHNPVPPHLVYGNAIRRYVEVQNVSEMDRTNTFTIEDNPKLWKLAEECARLYNEVNFERRQAYIHYKPIKWYPKQLYEKYAPVIGSATAQQIINKNNEAWKSFLALKRLEAKGKLPKHVKKVSMPRYWKKNGRRELRIIVRNDCYRIDDEHIYLPKGLKLKYRGVLKWKGKAGRLEIVYDEVEKMWRGFMTVRVEKPPIRGGYKPLYIDLGVINLATVWFEGLKQPIAFSGKSILSDWWYWTRKIAKEQSRLAKINKVKTSKRLRRLYRMRQRRFKHAVNAMIKTIIENTHQLGISKIVLGRLKNIRDNSHNGKTNTMINNFWSFNYIVRRFKEKAEEYGIKVKEKSEYRTSSECPFCHSEGTRRHRGLFYCRKCEMAMNADAVGALNMARNDGTIIPSPYRGRDNGVVAHPTLLRWNGMRWEPKRAVNTRPMNALEAKIFRLQSRRVSISETL
jgi:putative transposase